MTAARFVRNFAGYALARTLPTSILPPRWALPRRFRYRLFWLRPGDIRFKPAHRDLEQPPRVEEESLLNSMTKRFVVDGDWDLEARPLELHPTVDELFVQHLPMRSTGAFRWMLEAIHTGDAAAARGCTTLEQVEQRFARLERIFEDMAREGYKTQVSLGRAPVDEITICIARDGTPMLLRHGNHRLSIAKVLGVPRVPVIVRGVHLEWLRASAETFGAQHPVRAAERALASLSSTSLAGQLPEQGGLR